MRISDWSSDVCSSDLQVRRIKSNKPERGVGIWQVAEVQHHVRLNAQGALASRVAARVVGDCQRLAAHVAEHHVRMIAVKPHAASAAAWVEYSLVCHFVQ